MRVVITLDITWLPDGLEMTLAGVVTGAFKQSPTLRPSNTQVGIASNVYLIGTVFDVLLFDWTTDRLGRRKLFFIALGVYILAMLAATFSWSFASLVVFRMLTGAGTDGEYATINSTIQELTPARVRGWTSLATSGTFWAGAALDAGTPQQLLGPAHMNVDTGWRLCFFIGTLLGLIILVMRFWIPESLCWLIMRGRREEAQTIVQGIESEIATRGHRFDSAPLPALRMHSRGHSRLMGVTRVLFVQHRWRASVSLVLMATQTFFYNAIFFTYALVLTDFYGMPATKVGTYLLPFTLGNFLGSLLLGRLFDVADRRTMIAVTYAVSGMPLLVNSTLSRVGVLDNTTQTLTWTVMFPFALATASSAYLMVSETFPFEVRALAIALFYTMGTGLGDVTGSALFGWPIDAHSCGAVFDGYAFGAIFILLVAAVQAC